jgi:hypothetical protein
MTTSARANVNGSFWSLLLVVAPMFTTAAGLLPAAHAQSAQGRIEYVDIDRRTAEGAAITSLLRQEVLFARTATEFTPRFALHRYFCRS